jgi:hypothetical protein
MDEGILELSGAAAVEIAASHIAERGGATGKCANCKTATIGPYCAFCGQERDTHRRSVAGLLHDFFVDLVNIDSRILRTIYALLFMPGELPRAFREGRTVRYLPAMRLYLFTSLIFFLVLSATGIALIQLEVIATKRAVFYDAKGNPYIKNPAYDGPSDLEDGIKPTIRVSKSSIIKGGQHYSYSTDVHFFSRIGSYHSTLSKDAQQRLLEGTHTSVDKASKQEKDWMDRNIFGTMRKLVADPAALNGPLTTWIPRVLFLLLPAYALLLTIFYWRKRKDFYFVDHLVFSLSVHTFGFALLLVAAGAAQIMRAEYVAWAIVAIGAVYLFVAMKRFYRQSWFWTTFKFLFISFLHVSFLAAPAMAAVLALSVFGGSFG